MKNNKKFILLVLIIIIAIALCVGVSIILLDSKGKINQGNFRFNDIVITSSVEYKENQNNLADNKDLSGITYNVSQNNKLELLIVKQSDFSKMYINNISVKKPSKKGILTLSQTNKDVKIYLDQKNKEVEIYPEQKDDGQLYISLDINNMDVLTNASVPENTQVITFDGTFLDTLGIKQNDITMELKFNLNIVDVTGKTSVCEFKLNLPNDDLIKSGTSIIRENLNKFAFYIK